MIGNDNVFDARNIVGRKDICVIHFWIDFEEDLKEKYGSEVGWSGSVWIGVVTPIEKYGLCSSNCVGGQWGFAGNLRPF